MSPNMKLEINEVVTSDDSNIKATFIIQNHRDKEKKLILVLKNIKLKTTLTSIHGTNMEQIITKHQWEYQLQD